MQQGGNKAHNRSPPRTGDSRHAFAAVLQGWGHHGPVMMTVGTRSQAYLELESPSSHAGEPGLATGRLCGVGITIVKKRGPEKLGALKGSR